MMTSPSATAATSTSTSETRSRGPSTGPQTTNIGPLVLVLVLRRLHEDLSILGATYTFLLDGMNSMFIWICRET